MSGQHAKNSPSGAEGWMNCPQWAGGSGGSAADAGTARHEFVAMRLNGVEPTPKLESKDSPGYFYDEDVAADVQVAYDNVMDRIANFKLRGAVEVEMFVEASVPIGHITREMDATGTSDVVLLVWWPDGSLQIDVVDHKFGYRPVSATDNKQGRMYLLGAIEQFDIVGACTKASFAVNQPQARPTINEAEWTIGELHAFAEQAAVAAALRRLPDDGVVVEAAPGPHCDKAYCSKRATCPALEQLVIDTFDAVPDVAEASDEQLADSMAKVDLIESWCASVRSAVYGTLAAGGTIPGYKMVAGKRGHRAWADKAQAEALLKSMAIKIGDMYDMTVISPTSAEKLATAKIIGPRQWPKVKALITQPEGKPVVVPASDKRAPIGVADDFEVLEETCDLA